MAGGHKIGFETIDEWRRELDMAGFNPGREPDPDCAVCEKKITTRHVLLKDANGGGDMRLHTSCFRREVERTAKVLFAKGRRALSGKYRGSTLLGY